MSNLLQKICNVKFHMSHTMNGAQWCNDCTEVHFASFLSGGFTTMAVINPPERKLAKRTSVDWEQDVLGFSIVLASI
jgi:hypothetical protein